MKIYCLFLVTVIIAFFSSAGLGSATTLLVGPGGSLQDAIDNAADGDRVIVLTGNYLEHITLAKALTIQPATSNDIVTVAGNWTVANVPVGKIRLRDFRINGSLFAYNVADINLKNMHLAGDASYYRCGWLHHGTTCNALSASDCDSVLIDCDVVQNMVHDSWTNTCTIFQSTIGAELEITAEKFWVGYSTVQNLDLNKGAGVVVGCHIDGNGVAANLVDVSGSVSVSLINCLIEGSYCYTPDQNISDICNGIYASGPNVLLEVVNTIIWNLYFENNYARTAFMSANAVCAINGALCLISGSILLAERSSSFSENGTYDCCFNGVYAGATAVVEYSNLYGRFGAYKGGVVPVECTYYTVTGVKFVNFYIDDYRLQTNSPCVDAGSPVARKNDWDGSRNDMGRWGGQAYDTNGWTTTRPVVLTKKAIPTAVIHGGGTIRLEAVSVVTGD